MVDTASDSDGNYVERRALKLETHAGSNDPLGYLDQYWCGLRAETERRFSNIDPIHLMRGGIIGKMHVVDVSNRDPDDFRFELFGYAIPIPRPESPRTRGPYVARLQYRPHDREPGPPAGTLPPRGRLSPLYAPHTASAAFTWSRQHLLVAIRLEPG